ncbi:hypothetical protein Acr_22g0002640 [Actinidia rufa]|uniref:Uncharacterized protein n=1 Tax=Actinidia rufa TaxID=165716 RepID=A0A7J0GJ78_9ERIC|nr:hypothetical protein Acr_22g0002640 [Actinidia rufa]
MRKIPNRDNTANVGDLAEMASQVHPILSVAGEIDQLEIGDVRIYGGCGWHSRKSEFSEMIEIDKAT